MKAISKKKRSIIVAIILTGAFIGAVSQTVMTSALPNIMTSFSISADVGQWLTTIYMMVLGIMIPMTAFLIDKFSTRKIFITSMVTYMLGSLIAALAPSFSILLFARILQAAGAGIIMPLVQYIVLLLYPMEQRGAAMGMVGFVTAMSPAIGPVLSGLLVDTFGWNSNYYVLAVVAFIDIVIAIKFLENVGETKEAKLDIASVVLSTLGFGGLLLGASNHGSHGFLSAFTIIPLVVGIVAIILFVIRQLKLDKPLLELRVFKSRQFSISIIVIMSLSVSLISASILIPIYLQMARGYSALVAGIFMIPASIIMALVNPYAGHLMDRYGPRVISILGLFMIGFGTFGFSLLTDTTSLIFTEAMFTIRFVGIAMALMPITTWGLNGLDRKYMSHGTAINNTLRQLTGAIGAATMISIMTNATKKATYLSAVNAQIYGINKAFFSSGIVLIITIVIAIIFVGKNDKKKNNNIKNIEEIVVEEEIA